MIELRKATASDALLLANTRRIVWEETYRGIYPDTMLDSYDLEVYAQWDRLRMENPAHHYYLFLDGEECAGYFSFGPYNYGSYKDFTLCLNNLYIRTGYKGRGLGKRAFACIRAYCREQGINKFFCGCNANNIPAVNFYKHMGGIQGDAPRIDVPKEDQILHFEFHIGE